MHRTTAAAATALAAASIAALATPAAADTTAPSPTRPAWTVIHPTYEQQPDVTLPPAAPSPTSREPIAPNWYPPLDPTAAVPVPAPAWRPRTTIAPPAPARRPVTRRVAHRPVHHHAAHHAAHHTATPQAQHASYHAGSGKWRVVHGETLSYIAGIFDVTVNQLARANGIADPDRIYAGQWLTIPAGAR
jgi:nucleoid-associated protein YgaU